MSLALSIFLLTTSFYALIAVLNSRDKWLVFEAIFGAAFRILGLCVYLYLLFLAIYEVLEVFFGKSSN